jgi:hypothetical protein
VDDCDVRVDLRNGTSSIFSTSSLALSSPLSCLSLFSFSLSMSVSSLLGVEYYGREKILGFSWQLISFFQIKI